MGARRLLLGVVHVVSCLLDSLAFASSAFSDAFAKRARVLMALFAAAWLALMLASASALAAGAPEVVTGQASNITTTSATLSGTVNPNGAEVTSCEFEYGPFVGFDFNEEVHYAFNGYTGAIPCLSAPGAGNEPADVSAEAAGLEPNTKYQFRLVAANANGEGVGLEGELTTASPPLIDVEATENIGTTSGRLLAQINPMGVETTYRFEYGPTAAYETSVPVPDASIGSGIEDVTVSQQLRDLQAGASYHYRIVATSANGTTYGPDQTFAMYEASAAVTDTCPNAQVRAMQFSSFLPDCRAWEMVSPPNKEGGDVVAEYPSSGAIGTRSSKDGNAVVYEAFRAFGDSEGTGSRGAEYVGERGSSGWVTHGITPVQQGQAFSLYSSSLYQDFSEDLSRGVFFALSPVTPGHPNVEKVENLYLRTDVLAAPPGTYELLSDSVTPLPGPPPEVNPQHIAFVGASADLTHILFETTNNLTPETAALDPAQPKAYEWDDGVLRLAGMLPDGEAAEASVAGNGAKVGPSFENHWNRNAVSRDGSRMIFTAGPLSNASPMERSAEGGDLYMRIDGETTLKLNVDERTEKDPNTQPAFFMDATPDDSKVFFLSGQALTDEAPIGYFPYRLYMYDVNAPEGKHLTLISENANAVSGVSDDGKFVYFLSKELLLPNQPRLPFHSDVELYVWHDGTLRAITPHGRHGSGTEEWFMGTPPYDTTGFRITPDGKRAVLVNSNEATARSAGVTIHAASDAQGCTATCMEVFVYDYETDTIACASCDPSGALPVSAAHFEPESEQTEALDAYPGGAGKGQVLRRAISDDGRYVFFDTADPLVASDTNGKRDVYEYDTANRSVHLISDGLCNCEGHFVDISPDGSNVFFTTYQQLVRADYDTAADLYDARVEGGIPAQNVSAPVACSGEECQGPTPSPPVFSLPASSTFSGAGNPSRPVVKSTTKRARHKVRRHKRQRRRAKHTRSATHTRRAGR